MFTLQGAAELFAVVPLLLEGKVEHGEVRVAGDLLDHIQERREDLLESLLVQRGVSLKKYQTFTPAGRKLK